MSWNSIFSRLQRRLENRPNDFGEGLPLSIKNIGATRYDCIERDQETPIGERNLISVDVLEVPSRTILVVSSMSLRPRRNAIWSPTL